MSNESIVLSAAMVGAASEEPAIGSGRVLAASVVGSVIEWYDYALYGTAAALIFGHLFFPNANPTVAMVGTFGTFAAGFVVRPLGGLVAGYYGDRLGRKATLVLTLMTMSLAAALIGCLPTYAQAGVWAPVLLLTLRLLQGFAVGGEWGGAGSWRSNSRRLAAGDFGDPFPRSDRRPASCSGRRRSRPSRPRAGRFSVSVTFAMAATEFAEALQVVKIISGTIEPP